MDYCQFGHVVYGDSERNSNQWFNKLPRLKTFLMLNSFVHDRCIHVRRIK